MADVPAPYLGSKSNADLARKPVIQSSSQAPAGSAQIAQMKAKLDEAETWALKRASRTGVGPCSQDGERKRPGVFRTHTQSQELCHSSSSQNTAGELGTSL